MNSRFTSSQKAAVREMLEIPLSAGSLVNLERSRVAVNEVRRFLDLPAIPYSRFVGPDCWLAGGQVLRWICNAGLRHCEIRGDFDFFFPSVEALNATARRMLDSGFRLHGYRTLNRGMRTYLKKTVTENATSGVWNEKGQLAPITHEIIERIGLTCIELHSPERDRLQLVTIFRPSPVETILLFDLSICQFAVDDTHLSFGTWTWNDLLRQRFRTENIRWPDGTFRRMFKYSRRGFLPYPNTAVSVSKSALAWSLAALRRNVFKATDGVAAGIPYTE